MHLHKATLAAAVGLTACTAAARGQNSTFLPAVEPGPDNHHCSTLAEGYLTGLARVFRALGQAHLNAAEARRIDEEAREHRLYNAVAAVHTYFDRKQANCQGRHAWGLPRPTAGQLDAIMKSKRAKSLTLGELNPYSGRIHWPEVLTDPSFDDYRQRLQPLFVRWAAGKGGRGSRVCGQVAELTRRMGEELRRQARQMHCTELHAARKFIDGLRLAAETPPGGVASTELSQVRFDEP